MTDPVTRPLAWMDQLIDHLPPEEQAARWREAWARTMGVRVELGPDAIERIAAAIDPIRRLDEQGTRLAMAERALRRAAKRDQGLTRTDEWAAWEQTVKDQQEDAA